MGFLEYLQSQKTGAPIKAGRRPFRWLWRRLPPLVPYFAGLLLAVAVFLAGGEALSLPFAVSAERYLPLAIHLAVNAFLLIEVRDWHVRRGRQGGTILGVDVHLLLFRLPLYGFAVINIVIAGKSLFAWPEGGPWGALLLLPAIFSFAEYSQSEPPEDEDAEAQEDAGTAAAESDESSTDMAEGDEPGPGLIWLTYLKAATLTAFNFAVVILLFGLGGGWYSILNLAVVDGRTVDLSRTPELLSAAFEAALPGMFGVVIILGGWLLGVGTWKAAVALFRGRDDMPGSAAAGSRQQELIASLHARIFDYGRSRTYPGYFAAIYRIGWVGFLVGMVGSIIGFIFFDQWVISEFAAQRTAGMAWAYYVDDLGPSILFVVFGFICWFASLIYILLRIFPRFAEFVMLRKNIAGPKGREVFAADLIWLPLSYDIRKGRIRSADRFDPAAYIQRLSRAPEKPFYVAAVLLLIAFLFFWYHDHQDYDLFTDDYIQYVDYWSGETHRAPYTAVTQVDLRCRQDGDDMVLGYDIHIGDDARIDILDPKAVRRHLADVEKVVRLVSAADPEFRVPDRGGIVGGGDPAMDRSCHRGLIDEFGRERGLRVWRMLDRMK